MCPKVSTSLWIGMGGDKWAHPRAVGEGRGKFTGPTEEQHEGLEITGTLGGSWGGEA